MSRSTIVCFSNAECVSFVYCIYMLNNKTVIVCGKVYSVVGHKLNRTCLGGFLTRRTKLRRTLFREFPIGINDPIGKPRRHILRVRNHPIETVFM